MHTQGKDALDVLISWMPAIFFLLVWAMMQCYGKLPSMDSVQSFVTMFNSRGGNILVLSLGSVYFFKYAMYLFLHLLHLASEGKITPDNAFALMATQFLTTTAFGAFSGALLKTMTGESPAPKNGNGSVVATVLNNLNASGGA